MLSKIFGFGHKKREKKAHPSESDDDSWLENFHLTERGLPKFERSQIRVIIFKDHDKKGDKCVLFDSKTAVRHETLQNAEEVRPKCRSSDAPLLGEMIFGSVEMTYKGPTVKVHSIRTPPQLLLTKVFALKPGRTTCSLPTQSSQECFQSSCRSTESVSGSISSLQSQNNSSDSEEHLMATSVPVSVDLLPSSTKSYQLQNVAEGLSYCPTAKNCANATFPRTSSGSYQRRWLRSQFTRMDYGCQRRNESFNEMMSMRLRRRPKIGIGVLFSLWQDRDVSQENNRLFQKFVFSHFPIIESHILQLKITIEKALLTSLQVAGSSFKDTMLNAFKLFADNIFNLYYAPRIRNPIWLTMLSQPDQCDAICEDLVPQLVKVIENYNTKETSCFMASLLTAVLTYHIAWVTTVTPSSVQARRAYLDKHSSETLNVLGVSHPYNPLWAQLSDLYGGCGDPTRIVRTVVVGKDKNRVTLLLHILTYFIRCSEVYQHAVEQTPNFSTQCSGSLPLNVSTQNNSNNVSEVSKETLKVDSEDRNCDKCLEKLLCAQCHRLSMPVKEEADCLVDRTFEACSCSGVFPGNTKENRLWKSFLRTSCCDRACGSLSKDMKHTCLESSNSLTLDGVCLSGRKLPENGKTINGVAKLTRQDSSDGVFCIQNDGKTFSLDRQSILNKFVSSFPLCPICQGQLSFVGREFSPKCGTTLNSTENGFCGLCEKLKTCCCQMLNSESNVVSRCASSTTISSDYSSGNSFQSFDVEKEYLRSVSIDSGLNLQSNENCEEKDPPGDQACLLELPEFGPEDKDQHSTSILDYQLFSFGRSLMAGYCDQYLPDFVLHGTEVCTEEQPNRDLKIALQQPVVDSPVLETVVIIADTNNWKCTVKTLRKSKKGSGNYPSGVQSNGGQFSQLVDDFLTSFCNLWEMNMSAQFCLMHLEDKMKEIYLRSKVISEYLLTQKKYVTMGDLMSTFGYSECDLALLMSVVGVHSPLAISKIPVS